MKLRILAGARRDLVEGFHFYEMQSEGVGVRFLDALFSDIDSLVHHAGIHPIFFEKYHRLLSRRFPFAVYYRVQNVSAVVYAVVDCRRNPAWISSRLIGRGESHEPPE